MLVLIPREVAIDVDLVGFFELQKMRYVAAYLLASLSEDEGAPTKDKITAILGSVGIDIDDEKLGKVRIE